MGSGVPLFVLVVLVMVAAMMRRLGLPLALVVAAALAHQARAQDAVALPSRGTEVSYGEPADTPYLRVRLTLTPTIKCEGREVKIPGLGGLLKSETLVHRPPCTVFQCTPLSHQMFALKWV